MKSEVNCIREGAHNLTVPVDVNYSYYSLANLGSREEDLKKWSLTQHIRV
jgi:hypothetical protein